MYPKMRTTTSLTLSVGSWITESAIKRTIPISLKQLLAKRNATPAAYTASPRA